VTSVLPPQPPRPQEGSSSRRRATGVGVAAVRVVAALAVGWLEPRPRPGPTSPGQAAATSSSGRAWGRSTPRPSRPGALPIGGVPPAGPTGLRLLVADVPAPVVLDVDRGTSRPISGLPTDGDRGVGVLPVGNHALVLSSPLCHRCPPDAGVYLLRRSTAVTRLGTAGLRLAKPKPAGGAVP
jgi:hypothetical protein